MVIVIILFTIFIKEVCVYSVYEFSLLVNTTSKVSGYFRKFMKKKRYSEMDKNYFGHGTLFIELPVMSRLTTFTIITYQTSGWKDNS